MNYKKKTALIIESLSIGFIVCILMTLAEIPSFSNTSAASKE